MPSNTYDHNRIVVPVQKSMYTAMDVRLLNKPNENEVALREKKIPLKYCHPLEFDMLLKKLDLLLL